MSTLKTLFLILFCSISTIVIAQQYIGIKGRGINSHSDFHFGLDRLPDDRNKTRPFISIFAELGANPYYSFTPDIHFARNGNFIPLADSVVFIGSNNRIDYVGVGLINRFKVFSNEYELYGLLGPQVRLAVGGAMNGQRVDFKDINLKRLDMNLRTGVGLSKVNKNYKMILEWVYDFPFFDINSTSEFIEANDKSTGLLIGLEFKLKRKEKE